MMVDRRQDDQPEYQVPLRVLQDLARQAAMEALEAHMEKNMPTIAAEAAKQGVGLFMDEVKKSAGGGLFQLVKLVSIAALLLIAGFLAGQGRIG